MVLDLLGMIVTLGGLFSVPDVVASLVCTTAENLPCRPLTLACLFAGAGRAIGGIAGRATWLGRIPDTRAASSVCP